MNDLPGKLIHLFGVSIIDAVLLAWLALLWYRRSVRRLMRGAVAAAATPTTDVHQPSPPATSPLADELQLAEEHILPTEAAATWREASGRVILAYCLGAAAYAAIMTALKFSSESSLPAVAWLVDWWTQTWPILPTLVAVLVLDRSLTLRLALLYLAGGALLIALFTAAVQLSRGTLDSAPLTNVFWAIVSLAWTAAIPLAVVAFTGWRRVRAVMPLVLAATLLFGLGSMFFRELLIRAMNLEAFRSWFLGGAARTSIGTIQYALFLVVCLPVGWIAWRLLTRLANAFAAKRFSDVQLAIDCWWAVAAAESTATTLATTHGMWGIVGGVAAFAAYRLTVFAVLRGYRPTAAAVRRLLLLRVFGYQTRTESLFDRVAQAWRFRGPVQLIAGVDLAMRTVDPGDLLALLNGQLPELYVRDPRDVAQRVARLDLQPDPDGRFRINEVYCHDTTWRPALEAVLDATDTVLMDVRSFSGHNAGCIFELEQLTRRLPSDCIVLVCDRTTDLPLLRQTLGRAWAAARADGTARGSGRISTVCIERHTRAEFAMLMHRLSAREAASAATRIAVLHIDKR
jgi:hypothetical protein